MIFLFHAGAIVLLHVDAHTKSGTSSKSAQNDFVLY